MATVKPPKNERPPLCKCGCENPVNWLPGKGWASYLKGHSSRGRPGSRRGVVLSDETKKRMSDAHKKRWEGKRRRDLEETPGIGVYATWEFREAKAKLKGQPCSKCGTTVDVCAHHEVPGDDSTLVPLCRHCHPTEHASPGAHGQGPPDGEAAPLCACGCGLPVQWKRVRGWAAYRKGHGNAIVPGGTKDQEPPLCACGCGEPVGFKHGKGWSEYKTGHRQRVEGAFCKPPEERRQLSEDDVKDMRAMFSKGSTLTQLSKLFRIGKSSVSMIVRRKSWKHVA